MIRIIYKKRSHAQLTGTASTLSTTLTTTSGPGPEDTCYARGECDPTFVLEASKVSNARQTCELTQKSH